jgi:hypothetical protein
MKPMIIRLRKTSAAALTLETRRASPWGARASKAHLPTKTIKMRRPRASRYPRTLACA